MTEGTEESVHERVDKLEAQIKEREIYLFRALKTLVNDIHEYRAGKREDVNAALLGVLFAWLRPRVVLIVGSVLASVCALLFAGAQIYILWNQNLLLERQNDLMSSQSELLESQVVATEVQGMTLLVESLNSDDETTQELAVHQLVHFGQRAVPVLLNAANSRTDRKLAIAAVSTLLQQRDLHTANQVKSVIATWARNVDIYSNIYLETLRYYAANKDSDLELQDEVAAQLLSFLYVSTGYFDNLGQRLTTDPSFRHELSAELPHNDPFVRSLVKLVQVHELIDNLMNSNLTGFLSEGSSHEIALSVSKMYYLTFGILAAVTSDSPPPPMNKVPMPASNSL